MSEAQRANFWRRVAAGPNGCIVWTGFTNPKGYGLVGFRSPSRLAHRVAWEMEVGPIPQGMQIDHVCRVARCVNHKHLEVVTLVENLRRRDMARRTATTCAHGHMFTPENTRIASKGYRVCVQCARRSGRESYARRKATR